MFSLAFSHHNIIEAPILEFHFKGARYFESYIIHGLEMWGGTHQTYVNKIKVLQKKLYEQSIKHLIMTTQITIS